MENGGNGAAAAGPQRRAKKRGGSIFRAVALALRGRRSKKATASTADTVKTLVGGMRPLHCSIAYHPPAPPPPPADVVLDAFYDAGVPPSPCAPRSAPISRYASAEDLQLLDASEDKEEEGGGDGGPNAIDMQAEEFIAMFYKQMRLQVVDEEKSTVEEAAEACKAIEEVEAASMEDEISDK